MTPKLCFLAQNDTSKNVIKLHFLSKLVEKVVFMTIKKVDFKLNHAQPVCRLEVFDESRQ